MPGVGNKKYAIKTKTHESTDDLCKRIQLRTTGQKLAGFSGYYSKGKTYRDVQVVCYKWKPKTPEKIKSLETNWVNFLQLGRAKKETGTAVRNILVAPPFGATSFSGPSKGPPPGIFPQGICFAPGVGESLFPKGGF